MEEDIVIYTRLNHILYGSKIMSASITLWHIVLYKSILFFWEYTKILYILYIYKHLHNIGW